MTAMKTEWTERLLRDLTQCQVEFLAANNPKAAFERLLASLLSLTDSEYGFIGEVLYRDGAPYLKTHAITDISWNAESREFHEKNATQSLEFFNLNTLFGAVMTTGEMILSNDPPNDPRAGGLPPGHPPLESFLGIPLAMGGELLGMAGIANRPGGYDEELYHQLEAFRITVTTLVYQLRADRKWQAAIADLSSNQKKLEAIFDAILDGLIVIDFRGLIIDMNPAACRMFRRDRAEMIGKNVSMLMPAPHNEQHDQYLKNYYRSGVRKIIGTSRVVEGLRADGSTFPCLLGVTEILDQNTRYFVGTIKDITEQRQQEENLRLAKMALEDERRRLANIIEATHVGTWEWNIQTGETRFNERWAEIIGYPLADLEPVSIDTWVKYTHPEDLQASSAALEKHFRGEAEFYEIECRMGHREGRWVWVLDRGKVFSWADDGKPLMMFGTHQDITQRKEYEARIRHMAMHDPLTGLPTLRLAYDRIQMAIEQVQREKKSAAVFYVDLDGFKAVNDAGGHRAGDQLLQTIATRLRQAVRGIDTVARIGGDEFLVILTSIDNRENARKVAHKLLEQVRDPIDIEGNAFRVGFSIGIAMIPDDGLEPKGLIEAADVAMYRVKNSGKNGVEFYSERRNRPD